MKAQIKPKKYRIVDLHLAGRSKLRLLIYHPLCQDYVRTLSSQVNLKDITGQSLEMEALDKVDVLLTWRCPESVLAALRNLKWVQTTSAGINQLLDYFRRRPDLIVTTTKGLQAEGVSSMALLMMLAFHWKLPALLERQKKHTWEKHHMEVISKSTCAVVGLGNIGRMVAAHAKHLGMRVVGLKRQKEPVENVDQICTQEQLHEMLGIADFVVLSLPLTEETRGMFGGAEFKAMKQSAYLIQVARGGIVDERALLSALNSGKIAGAAIDVFEEEPLPADNSLWDAPNIIITPHLAGVRGDYVEGASAALLHNLRVFPNKSLMKGLADAKKGY